MRGIWNGKLVCGTSFELLRHKGGEHARIQEIGREEMRDRDITMRSRFVELTQGWVEF